MSYSQKEIAAPKDCKTFIVYCISAIAAVTLVMLFAFYAHAEQTGMFAGRTALSVSVIIVLAALSIGLIITLGLLQVRFKTARFAAVFGFSAIFSTILVLSLALLQREIDKVLFGSFKLSMLYLIICTVLIVAGCVFIVIKNRGSKGFLLCSLLCAIVSLSAIYMYYLRVPSRSSGNMLWTIGGFSSGIIVFIAFIFILNHSKWRKTVTTKWLTYCATFAALSIVCKMLGNAISFSDTLKITVVYIPWVISGLVLGPVGGMTCALVSDVIGQLLVPAGMAGINPFIMVANTLFPLFPALFYKYTFKERRWLGVLIGMIISMFVCTLGISTFGQWYMYYKDTQYLAYLAKKAFTPLVIAVNYVIIVSLLPALKRAGLLDLKFLTRRETPAAKAT